MKHSTPIKASGAGPVKRCAAARNPAAAPTRRHGSPPSGQYRKTATTVSAAAPLSAARARQARISSMGEMAASIAHEVSQPLAAIIINAQAAKLNLQFEHPGTDKARAAIGVVLEAAARADALLRSIHNLARNATVQPVGCRIDQAVDALRPLVQGRLDRAGVTLQLGAGLAPSSGHSVQADPVQLQQLLLNLINNAIDAMSGVQGRARELRIDARRQGAALQVCLSDSGSGLPPGDSAQLFQPLVSGKAGGMGMGLAICRAIVESHGGRIHASPGARHGSVFSFTLPCAPAETGLTNIRSGEEIPIV